MKILNYRIVSWYDAQHTRTGWPKNGNCCFEDSWHFTR